MVNMMPLDEQLLYNQVISSMEKELGEVLSLGDERRIVAGNILSVVISAINQGNAFAKAQFLKYSYGHQLDNLGDFVAARRLPATNASVVITFTVVAPAGVTVTIPAGTRVTADGKRFFITTEALLVEWDVGIVATVAMAIAPGSAYNGYPVGTIKTIVDPITYVTKVSNTSPSSGGTDVEDDDSYRERILSAPGGFSTAGPTMGYIYWARTADSQIGDVNVTSPAAREVVVTVLLKGGIIPGKDVLDKVTRILSANDVRPITDLVTVNAAEPQSFDINPTYYIANDDVTTEITIKTAVTEAFTAYQLWQRSRLGRAINPDQLRRMALSAGACRIDIPVLTYTAVNANKVAVASAASTITYGGLL